MLKRTSDHSICKRKRLSFSLILTVVALLAPLVRGQIVPPPVFTDDSPEAAQWFDRAGDQIRVGNTAEALRLYQRLLDQFPSRLLRTSETSESFTSVRRRVQAALLAQPDLLKTYIETNEPAARRLLDEGRPSEVFISRFLTPSGLTAGLDLAESSLVRARFDFAVDVLEQCESHPSLGGEALARWATLSALAGVYDHRESLAQRALDRVKGAPDGPRIAALAESLRVAYEPPLEWRAVTPASALEGATLRQMGKSPTWRDDMDSPYSGAAARRRGAPGDTEARADEDTARLLSVIPVVTSDFVYIHNGARLSALDRFDGRERWSADYRLASPRGNDNRFGALDAFSTTNDPMMPALGQDRVVAIVARPATDPDLRTLLVCHDAGSGQRLWTITPGAVDGELNGASFVGVPIVHDGLVLLMVRKQTLRLVSDYLVAVELSTGHKAWRQHIASSAIFGYYAVLPSTAPLVDSGMIYLSTPLGAIAALDARTGLVRWLKVLEPFGAQARADASPPCTFDTMLMTPLGLVTFTPSRHGIAILDPQTGEQRSFRASSTWGDPKYLVQTDDAILAVGSMLRGQTVLRVPLDDFDHPQGNWAPLRPDEFLNGRITAGAGRVFVPTNQRLRLLGDGGKEIESVEINELAVPVVVGGEVLLASLDRIESYIPYEVGEPHLRERLEANPHDPNPAISLARLAFQHRRLDPLMKSIDRAIEIINEDPLSEINATAQQRLFAGMLDMAPHAVLPDDLSNAIYYRLELLAASPQQRLAYLLSHASSLAQAGQAAAAIDAYETILTTPALMGETWRESGSTRRVEDVARQRLSDLVAGGHRDLYRSYEEAAQREFDNAAARGRPDELLAVAQRYPMAPVATEACIRAARTLREQGQDEAAAEALRLALRLQPPHPAVDAARGELLRTYEAQNKPFEAMTLLRAIERDESAAMIPTADAGAQSIDAWRRRILAGAGDAMRLPEIGALKSLVDIQERQVLLVPTLGRPSSRFALVRDKQSLIGYEAGNAALFMDTIDSPLKDLLAVHDDVAVLAVLGARSDRNVEAYDMRRQQTLWRSRSFDEWFDAGRGRRGGMDLRPAATARQFVFADEDGRVGCIDRATGNPDWAITTALDAVKFVQASDSVIMIGGEIQADGRPVRGEIASSHVMLLRPETGAMFADLEPDAPTPLDFAAISSRSEVVYASLGRVYCYDALRGEQRWSLDSEAMVNPIWAGIVGSTLLVFPEGASPLTINLQTAEVTPQPNIRQIARNEASPRLFTHLDRYVLKTHNGVYIIESDGTVTGLMAGSGRSDATVQGVTCAADRIVIVLTIDNANGGLPRSVEIRTLDLYGRQMEHPYKLDDRTELPRADGVQAVDGHVVLDVGRDVVFIDAPVASGP